MSDLFWLTDEQMDRLRAYFPKSHDKPRVYDRRVLSGIVFVNRNGFTTAMLSGLKGAAPTSNGGTINVFDLFNYVSEAVRQAVPGRQHPIFKASQLEDNFPVALAQGGTKSTTSGSDSARQRDLEQILVGLFPSGPTDQDIWLRAGGDLSYLKLAGNGRSQWFSALRILTQGGGGASITRESLIEAALEEFPNHRDLRAIL